MGAHLRRSARAAAAAALLLYPPIAAAAYLLLGRFDASAARRWAWCWAAMLPALVSTLVHQDGIASLVGQFAFVVVLGGMSRARPGRPFRAGLLAGLVVLLAVGLVEREASRRLWAAPADDARLHSLASGTTVLDGDAAGWRPNGVRTFRHAWRVPTSAERFELVFEARLLSGQPAKHWYTPSAAARHESMDEAGEPFVRISNPGARLVRRVRTDDPLAGRSFRATLELRGPDRIHAEGCDGLRLRTYEPTDGGCTSLTLTSSWRSQTVQHRFAEDVHRSAFDFAVGSTGTPWIDVRRVAIEERIDGAWVALPPAEPAGVLVRIPDDRHVFEHATLGLVPDATWATSTLPFEHSAPGASEVDALLQVEPGLRVELRGIELRALDEGSWTSAKSLPAVPRPALWFGSANLLAHSVLATVLLAVAVTSGPGSHVMLALGTAVLTLVGSRAALAALLVGGLAVLAARSGWRRLVVPAGIVLAVSVGAWLLDVPAAERVVASFAGDVNTVSRVEIWRTSADAILQGPFFGFGDGAFPMVWASRHPEQTSSVPAHAHSLWLQLGIEYGIPGVASGVLLALGLAYLAHRRGGAPGLAAALVLLAVQAVDATLLYVGVLVPLVVLLNAFAAPPARAGRAERRAGRGAASVGDAR